MTIRSYHRYKGESCHGCIEYYRQSSYRPAIGKVSGDTYVSFTGLIPPQTFDTGEQFCMLSYTGLGTAYPFSFAEQRIVSGETNEVKVHA